MLLDGFGSKLPCRSDFGGVGGYSSAPTRTSAERFTRYKRDEMSIIADSTSYASLSDQLYHALDRELFARPSSSDHILSRHYDQDTNMPVHGEPGVSHCLHSSLCAMAQCLPAATR